MQAQPPSAALYDGDTLGFYETNARPYSGARPDEVSPDLHAFLAKLVPGSRILELGCGSGRDAAEMQKLGFEIDATDGTHAMAALASERLGRTVRVLRFDELDVRKHYDAVVAFASLLHVPHSGLPEILRRVRHALKPCGWHFASYKTAGIEGPDTHKRYYNYLSRDDADRMYRQAGGWACLDYQEYDGVGHFSAPSRWLTVTARR